MPTEEPLRCIALLLEYDGTAFAGSQLQPGLRTVQGVVEAAFEAVTGKRRRVAFAGRTDAGVHAVGQVAAVRTDATLHPEQFAAALNHHLPDDIAVRSAAEVAVGFDPRRHAVARVYGYTLVDGRLRSPLSRQRAWHRKRTLDVRAMAEAASLLPVCEQRDWAAFASPVPAGYPTVRTMYRCVVQRLGVHRVVVTVEADGFLPHQIRRTVGALERVGAGAMSPQAFAALLDGAPASVGPTAPPQGLVLREVCYPVGTVDWGETVDRDDDEDVPPER